MGHFNELPSDVVWLVYRRVLQATLRNVWSMSFHHFEVGAINFTSFHHNAKGSPNDMLNSTVATLASLSKSSLVLIKKKTCSEVCKIFDDPRFKVKGWLFVKGALTGD